MTPSGLRCARAFTATEGSERMKTRTSVWSCGILAAAVLCLVAGCDDSTKPKDEDTGPTYQARTSPQNLLANLKLAYEERELTPYDSLLATEFEFYFSEEDQRIAEKLTRNEEITVHENMFSSTQVEDITLTFSLGDLALDTNEPDPAHPGQFLWTLTATNVDLVLRVTRDGMTTFYDMEDGIEQFWFREESWTDAHGNAIWMIVKWRELTDLIPDGAARTMAVEEGSWGSIKSMFR
jgi:hypothetical protein